MVRAVYRELLREGNDSIDDWQRRGVSVNNARAALDLLRRADVIQPDGRIWSAWPDPGGPGVVRNPRETK